MRREDRGRRQMLSGAKKCVQNIVGICYYLTKEDLPLCNPQLYLKGHIIAPWNYACAVCSTKGHKEKQTVAFRKYFPLLTPFMISVPPESSDNRHTTPGLFSADNHLSQGFLHAMKTCPAGLHPQLSPCLMCVYISLTPQSGKGSISMTKSKNYTVNGAQEVNARLFITNPYVILLLSVLWFNINRLSCDTELVSIQRSQNYTILAFELF